MGRPTSGRPQHRAGTDVGIPMAKEPISNSVGAQVATLVAVKEHVGVIPHLLGHLPGHILPGIRSG
ncbi:hypothetical protein [Nocardiopsis rhodophaea]|uniref:hypothetical protein n=1 Tax=Nocardiopsis rhodophaea TaxID=280238 RepID=UPI0031CEAB8F